MENKRAPNYDCGVAACGKIYGDYFVCQVVCLLSFVLIRVCYILSGGYIIK